MRTDNKRRTIWAVAIGVPILIIVLAIIILVDASATSITESAKRCAPSIWQSQWPIYLGCAIAAREGLAAGLFGAAGALFAAWLAYAAIQEQIAAEKSARERYQHEEEERRRQQHSDAKTVSVVCLLPPIRAAAALVIAIDRAVAKDATNEEKEGSNVERALKHLGVTLSSFTIREAVRDLGADDRTMYLEIVAFLSTLLSVSEHGASKPGSERYKVELSALAKLFKILNRFDAGLAEEMASVESLKKRSAG